MTQEEERWQRIAEDHNQRAARHWGDALQAQRRVAELEQAIRQHRNARGDDRCWMDDEELYNVLPEGYTPPARDTSVELALCQKFIHNRHHPQTEYVSPQRRIEKLEAEIRVDDELLKDRDRLLEAIPCPTHGACVPFALEEIKRLRGLETKDDPKLQRLLNRLRDRRDYCSDRAVAAAYDFAMVLITETFRKDDSKPK